MQSSRQREELTTFAAPSFAASSQYIRMTSMNDVPAPRPLDSPTSAIDGASSTHQTSPWSPSISSRAPTPLDDRQTHLEEIGESGGWSAEEMLRTESDAEEARAHSPVPLTWSPTDERLSPVSQRLRALNHTRCASLVCCPFPHAAASLETLLLPPLTHTYRVLSQRCESMQKSEGARGLTQRPLSSDRFLATSRVTARDARVAALASHIQQAAASARSIDQS